MPETSATLEAPFPLTEAVLASFERAAQVSRFDEQLFDPRAGDDLPAQLAALVEALKGVKLDALAARTGWADRLLGADVEARLEFAWSHRACTDALERARQAAARAAERIQRLEAAAPKVEADQARLTQVFDKGQALLAQLPPAQTPEDSERAARFRRRVSNLQAVIAASSLTLAQIPTAIAHLRAVLDRFNDVDLALFPVWERHALALTDRPADPETVSAARAAARAVIDRLVEHAEGAA